MGSLARHCREPGYLSTRFGNAGAPKVKSVRGFSDYGFSYVYVIFEDGTDLYWARSRVLENLNRNASQILRALN